MTLRHVTWALDLTELDAIGRMILVTVAEEADDGGFAAPGFAKLARRASCSVDTVRRRLGELARAGVLERLEMRKRADGGLERTLLRLRTSEAENCEKLDETPPSTVLPPPSTVLPPPSTVLPPPSTVLPTPSSHGATPSPHLVPGAELEPQEAAGPRARAETQPFKVSSREGTPKNTPVNSASEEAELAEERRRCADAKTPVEAFLSVWPIGAFEPVAPIERAWRRLEEAARKLAIERAAGFLEACKRTERRHGPATHYLRNRKWEAAAATRITAAQGGVYVRLGSPAADAWLNRVREDNPQGFQRGWPAWAITKDPASGALAIFRPSLFPPPRGERE